MIGTLDRTTPVIVQGITGRMGSTHAALMRGYGTNIVGGTSTRTDTKEAAGVPVFAADAKGMATRVAAGKVLNAIAPKLPALSGGSADLDPSTHTAMKGQGDFNPALAAGADGEGSDGGGWSHAGRNIHFGVREHAMGAVVNGLDNDAGGLEIRRPCRACRREDAVHAG